MSSDATPKARSVKKPSRIVVIAPEEPVEYFGVLWEGVESASAEISSLGVEVESHRTAGHDLRAQKELLTSLLESAPDAIAMVPAHSTALDELIERHTLDGTHVVTFNADAPRSSRCSYVGADAARSGLLAAEVLTKLMAGQNRNGILAFTGPLEAGHLAARYNGFLAGLPKWRAAGHVIACYRDLGNVQQNAVRLLREHAEAGGIYVGHARAYEVGAALDALGCRIPCVGFDNTDAVRPFLEKNIISAVIDQNAYQQGYVAVQRAYETISALERSSRSTLIPSTVVFASNARETPTTDTLNETFELLVRKRTARLRSYQRMLQRANLQLIRLAETDALTGLYNRRKIEELFSEHLAASSPASPLSVLMVDVNDFKSYNDCFGHHTGDEVLRVLARVLGEQTGPADCCGRIGGDEFCVLLRNAGHAAAVEARLRIYGALEEAQVSANRGTLPVRVSIGIATAPDDGTKPHELLLVADRDMYAEKHRHSMNSESRLASARARTRGMIAGAASSALQ
jgi:diguanylate cyclase (GGDEF)-like protein